MVQLDSSISPSNILVVPKFMDFGTRSVVISFPETT